MTLMHSCFPPHPDADVLPRRRLAHHALQWLLLGMGMHSTQPALAQASRSGCHTQWLRGHALHIEDVADLEWWRLDGDGLQMRVRSFRTAALWVAPSLGTPAEHTPRRLSQLRWNCALQAGVRWRSLTLRDGPAVRALMVNGEPLAAQHLNWPEGLLIQHGLMLRWELEADAQDRELAWQDIQLDWT